MKSNRTRNILIGGAAVLTLVAGGGAYAIASSDGSDDKDVPLTRAEVNQATKAARAEVNGRVLYVEYEEDHGGGYEVEMQKKDGSEVEVYLTKSFQVAGVETENDHEGGKGKEHDDYGSQDGRSDSNEQGEKTGR